MHDIVKKMGLDISELPDFTTVCARKQHLKMAVWRTLLRLSADLHNTGEVQAIDATGFDSTRPAVTTQIGQTTPLDR